MIEDEPRSFSTNSVTKEDVLSLRPDLAQQIEALSDADIKRIANRVGEALQETYWIALGIVLANYIGVSEAPDTNDAEGES